VVAKTSRSHIRVVAVAFIMSLLFRGGDAFSTFTQKVRRHFPHATTSG
jgi:hypothetical protein